MAIAFPPATLSTPKKKLKLLDLNKINVIAKNKENGIEKKRSADSFCFGLW